MHSAFPGRLPTGKGLNHFFSSAELSALQMQTPLLLSVRKNLEGLKSLGWVQAKSRLL